MSLEKLERIYQEIIEPTDEIADQDFSRRETDFSQLVIPFSKVFKSYKIKYIYSGNEKIPFKERKREFRMILKHEFSNLLNI